MKSVKLYPGGKREAGGSEEEGSSIWWGRKEREKTRLTNGVTKEVLGVRIMLDDSVSGGDDTNSGKMLKILVFLKNILLDIIQWVI